MFSSNGAASVNMNGGAGGSTPVMRGGRTSTESGGVNMGITAEGGSGSLRLLVVGESSAGKSYLVQCLLAACAAGETSGMMSSSTTVSGTIGVSLESLVWKDLLSRGSHVKSRAIELVEVSGNRSFGLAARKAIYNSSIVHGVILVHDSANPASAAALPGWYQEVTEFAKGSTHASYGEGASTLPFFVFGARLVHSQGAVRRSMGAVQYVVQQLGKVVIPSQVLVAWAHLEYWVLWAMSLILFGWAQTMASKLKPPKSGRKCLEELYEDRRCQGSVDGCPLYSLSAFNDQRSDLSRFLNYLAFQQSW